MDKFFSCKPNENYFENDIEDNGFDPSEIMTNMGKSSNNYSEDDIEVARAIAKRNFEGYSKERVNFTPETDEIMNRIQQGHVPNKIEVFTLMCDEPEKIEQYKSMEQLKERVSNGKISLDDFETLIGIIGFDEEISNALKREFELKGILISEYPSEEVNKSK